MARDTIDITTCVRNSAATETQTVRASGLTGTSGLKVDNCDVDERFTIRVENTGSVTGPVTILAGDFDAAGQGNLTVQIGGTTARVIGPLEGARFKQDDGTFSVDWGVTGTIAATKTP